jgi:hypothetical protein
VLIPTLERFLKIIVVFFRDCAIISVMNSMINPQDPIRDQVQIQPEEVYVGWPGDGSGEDDLADLMAYGDEGCCDGPEDSYEDDMYSNDEPYDEYNEG